MADNTQYFMALFVPELYPVVLGLMSVHALQVPITGVVSAIGGRKAFTDDEFRKQFEEEHLKSFPEEAMDKGGNPDAGTGWYAAKLPLKDWYEMNVKQRIFQNFLELLPIALILPPIAGLFFPIPTIVCLSLIILGRIIYSCSYQKRAVGFLMVGLSNLTLIVLSIWTSALVITAGN